MRAYELMIIIDGELDDAAVRKVLDQVNQLVTEGQGEVRTTDLWGKRRFAYRIRVRPNHYAWEGTYVVLEITTEAPNLDALERALRIADEVVRHKLIRLPDDEARRRGLLEATTPADSAAG
jgi:small subunit ribosomal protein S6